ncbi:MAG: type II secretion system protein, partial [Opitutae bacterium]
MITLTDLRRNKYSKQSRVRGFTLVEILIVLALIGIVAGLAMSNLGEIFGGVGGFGGGGGGARPRPRIVRPA